MKHTCALALQCAAQARKGIHKPPARILLEHALHLVHETLQGRSQPFLPSTPTPTLSTPVHGRPQRCHQVPAGTALLLLSQHVLHHAAHHPECHAQPLPTPLPPLQPAAPPIPRPIAPLRPINRLPTPSELGADGDEAV